MNWVHWAYWAECGGSRWILQADGAEIAHDMACGMRGETGIEAVAVSGQGVDRSDVDAAVVQQAIPSYLPVPLPPVVEHREKHAIRVILFGGEPSADPDGIDVVAHFSLWPFAPIDPHFELLALDREGSDNRLHMAGKRGRGLPAVSLINIRLASRGDDRQATRNAEAGQPGSDMPKMRCARYLSYPPSVSMGWLADL